MTAGLIVTARISVEDDRPDEPSGKSEGLERANVQEGSQSSHLYMPFHHIQYRRLDHGGYLYCSSCKYQQRTPPISRVVTNNSKHQRVHRQTIHTDEHGRPISSRGRPRKQYLSLSKKHIRSEGRFCIPGPCEASSLPFGKAHRRATTSILPIRSHLRPVRPNFMGKACAQLHRRGDYRRCSIRPIRRASAIPAPRAMSSCVLCNRRGRSIWCSLCKLKKSRELGLNESMTTYNWRTLWRWEMVSSGICRWNHRTSLLCPQTTWCYTVVVFHRTDLEMDL
jgi:hypothetical protein